MRSSLALLCITVSSVATAQSPSLPDRGDALVATTRTFAFYSDPVTNLHDFLVWSARSRDPVEPASECVAALPAEQRAAFEHAREHYKVFARTQGNRLLLAVRYRLAGFGDAGIADAAAVEATVAELPPAAPAYRACWWSAHDARNRRWIAALQPLLAQNEEALSERLGELYGQSLDRPFPVDIVSYASVAGADSVGNPDHLLVSSIVPSNAGNSALEVVFHEASHTVFGPAHDGRLWTDLEAAAKADGAPLAPDFWHVLLFYTTGSAVKARFAERGIAYDQMLYAQRLFETSWPGFREALERIWQPYLDGRAPRAQALQQLVAAHKLPPRGDVFVASSRTFVFYSDIATNLHGFLVWNSRSPEPVETKPACLAGLPAEQREAFEHARDYYAKTFANGEGELVSLSIRMRLANLVNYALGDPTQIVAIAAELASATPAYRTCWWPEHDARNRRWVASLLPMLEANESALRARLAQLYGGELARSLPVDVLGFPSAEGGYAVLNPSHLLISSARPSNLENAALEALFIQASQTLFGRRAPGPLWQALQQASTSTAKPVSEDFTRLLVLFTTGRAVQERLAEQGVRNYEPYVYKEGLLEGAAPAAREALERVWRPAMDSRVPMAEAARQLVAALPAAPP